MKRCLFLAASLLAPVSSWGQAMTVTLLGTGHPEPSQERFGPATLVEARGQRLLVDAGRGVAQRFWELNIPVGEIRNVFLTHLHSDHVVGLPDAWLTGWLRTAFGRRSGPLHVYGPAGTSAMVASVRDAYREDVRARTATLPDLVTDMVGHDVAEGQVYDSGGVRVVAFNVDHGNPPIPALGYRIEAGGRSTVISGDTRRSENLIKFAQGADLLIHEVMAAGPGASATPEVARILSSHTTPEDAAVVFARVKPKLAVFTHISIVSAPTRRQAILDSILPRTSAYGGAVVLGEDRMTLVVGDSVQIRRPAGRTP